MNRSWWVVLTLVPMSLVAADCDLRGEEPASRGPAGADAAEHSPRISRGDALFARYSSILDDEDDFDRLETDRDSFTPSTRTAGTHRLIVEAAYTFLDNRGVPETSSFPELLFRYGVSERVELRLAYNYEIGGGGTVVSGIFGEGGEEEGSGVQRSQLLVYGAKVRIFDQHWLVPESSLILQGITPLEGNATDTHVQAIYVFGWEFLNRWKWDSAIRYATGSRENDRFNVWTPSTVLKIPVGERINVHAEYFGTFSDGRENDFVQQFISPGIHYLVNPDLEVGVRIGWGLNDQSARFFVNAGLGWRF